MTGEEERIIFFRSHQPRKAACEKWKRNRKRRGFFFDYSVLRFFFFFFFHCTLYLHVSPSQVMVVVVHVCMLNSVYVSVEQRV